MCGTRGSPLPTPPASRGRWHRTTVRANRGPEIIRGPCNGEVEKENQESYSLTFFLPHPHDMWKLKGFFRNVDSRV